MNYTILGEYVFIEECGYNVWSGRSHGRARLGERAYRQVCGKRRQNVTVALAISGNAELMFKTAFLEVVDVCRSPYTNQE